MTGNELTERDMRLMKKYGFNSWFAYRTFMSMVGERIEGDNNKMETEAIAHEMKDVAWPYAV